MRPIYNAYLVLIIVCKIFLLALDVLVYYNKTHELSFISSKTLKSVQEKVFAITEALMFFLLVLIFFPLRKTPNKNNAIIIVGHEREILFTLGIIGLIHINWKFLFLNK